MMYVLSSGWKCHHIRTCNFYSLIQAIFPSEREHVKFKEEWEL